MSDSVAASFYQFPHPHTADGSGLVAVTEELTPALLLSAYSQGLFPWTDNPVGWFSPDPRAVFDLNRLRLPSNLPRLWRRAGLRATCDGGFGEVVAACRRAHRAEGEWITPGFARAYQQLFARHLAHSVEIWRGEALVGGIYGVHIAGLFAGESMFHREANASKFALAVLAAQLRAVGVVLFDVQVLNPHTAAMGAREMSRAAYLDALATALRRPLPPTRWPLQPLSLGALAPPPSAAR